MKRLLLTCFVGLGLFSPTAGHAQPGAQREAAAAADTTFLEAPRRGLLVVERIEFEGRTRTPEKLALEGSGLSEGDLASPDAILGSVERLRESELFREVDVHTRRGTDPGRVVVVYTVREKSPHFRLGLGYEEFSGWYLIPIQLNLDNLTGRGEGLSLNTRFGYRVAGVDLTLRSRAARIARNFWEVSLRAETQDRVYFTDSTEVRHPVGSGGLDFRLGRKIRGPASVEAWLSLETADADSNASVNADRLGRSHGDDIPASELPPEIQRDLGRREQTRLGAALVLDWRRGSGLQRRGVAARLSGEGVFSDIANFGSWQSDVRAFVPVANGMQLAARARGGSISPEAPFYERYYAGGLYTVRGFPDHSLSPAHGNLNIATASVELRTSWIGPANNPRLVGLAFADAGIGWNHDTPSIGDISTGVGYGFRLRVPWLIRLGLDVSYPTSPSPVTESFRVNGSLGWTF